MHARGWRLVWALTAFGIVGALGLAAESTANAAASTTVDATVVRVADGPRNAAMVRFPNGQLQRLEGAPARVLGSDDRVRVTTTSVAGALAAASRVGAAGLVPLSQVQTVRRAVVPARAQYTAGAHRVTVVIGSPAGVTGATATAQQVRSQVAMASKFWSEQTRGTVTFAVAAIVGPVKMKASCSDYSSVWNEAAATAKFTQKANEHLAVVMPESAFDAGCSYGLGTVGTSVNSGGMVYVADTAWPVLAHELGHNLSLNHAAGTTKCTAADVKLTRTREAVGSANPACEIDAYGDPWDVMAASPANNAGSLSSAQAYRTGILPADAVRTAGAGTTAVTLNAVSTLTGLRAVRVVDPVSKETYFVEYRTRTGRDAVLYANMSAGVRVLRDVGYSSSWPATVALDATPTGQAGDMARHIPVGSSFSSYGGGVKVTVQAVKGTTASIAVTVGAGASGRR